jgi:hypothetical protein
MISSVVDNLLSWLDRYLKKILVICEDAYDADETAAGLRYICDDTRTVMIADICEVIPRSMADWIVV